MNGLIAEISVVQWYLMLGVIISIAGIVRLLLTRDLVARLIAMNIVSAGSLLILISLAIRSQPIDPVLSALVITGLVITVAFTGVGAVLVRRIEGIGERSWDSADGGTSADGEASADGEKPEDGRKPADGRKSADGEAS